MNIIKDKTGVYVELPKDSIKFESKEAEIMYDLTLENDKLQQELQRKDNIINELKKYLEYEIEEWKDVENEWGKIRTSEDENILDKIKELENEKI